MDRPLTVDSGQWTDRQTDRQTDRLWTVNGKAVDIGQRTVDRQWTQTDRQTMDSEWTDR